MPSFVQLNEATGFADGDPFKTPDEVREYFTVANLNKMGFNPVEQRTLDDYARQVISRGWHMEPLGATVLEPDRVTFGGTLAEIWHWLQGFKSRAPCSLAQQTLSATASFPEQRPGHEPGYELCSGTVREVMDWIQAVLERGTPQNLE